MAMQAAEFEKQLIEYIEADVALGDEPVERETDLLLTGLIDSLGFVMVSQLIQDELDIEIDPVDIVLENFQTVGHMVDYVSRRGALAQA